MSPSLGVLLQLVVFIAATQYAGTEPMQAELPSDLLDDVTAADVNETGEETATYDPSFDSDDSPVHHFTYEEIEINRWISIDRWGMEYTATDAEVIKNLEKALQLRKKHYSSVFDDYIPQQNATTHKRAVFDPDDRYPLSSSCNTGYLNTGCTAFLIGPYHALTAGHCVYDCSTRRWKNGATALDLYVGRNCYTLGRRMRWVQVWTNTAQCRGVNDLFNVGHDIAWIRFDTAVQSYCWFRLGWITANPTISIELCGYPTDKRNTYNCLYCSSCDDCRYHRERYSAGFWGWSTRYRDNEEEWQYTCDTKPGHSGSPITTSSGGYTFAVGVNAVEDEGLGLNYGTRITPERYIEIQTWRCANGYCPGIVIP